MRNIVLMVMLLITLAACDDFSTEPQVIVNAGYDTVYQGSEWLDAGAYLQVGFTRFPMTTTDQVDTTTLGFYDIMYEVIHEEVMYTAQRRVAVIEATSVIATLNPGIDTIFITETWVDAGISVPAGATYVVRGNVDTRSLGTYEIYYDVTLNGVTTTYIRYVTVLNNE